MTSRIEYENQRAAAADGYPAAITPVGHVERVPRRVRGKVAGVTVFDTTNARYLWDWPFYPQFQIPIEDVDQALLVVEGTARRSRGAVTKLTIRAGGVERSSAAEHSTESPIAGVAGTVRFAWDAIDEWFEEDERIFVHPRSPYVRVDALRSSRSVRVELQGVLLAESSATVMVFETGLPTRRYFERTAVRFEQLVTSSTETECPYKGTTSQYWSVQAGGALHEDLAWSYDFPTRQLLPVAGLVAFYDEKVDVSIDGVPHPRPVTHFG